MMMKWKKILAEASDYKLGIRAIVSKRIEKLHSEADKSGGGDLSFHRALRGTKKWINCQPILDNLSWNLGE